MKENRYHCCATCEHFRVEKGDGKTSYRCARLTYETKPHYRFNCWSPKEQVRRRMEQEAPQSDED
ncbi:hypothetical protein [Brevibacillus massiliensis]|jgi:hypothetical protein|uniref:hypothetical protein n=1 Tax=Brevibacillus massiliensis TaxID=1118054 RepID=UPI0002D880FD|nr:hypothetical protein [Brevibacillus massiliensis]